MDAHLKRFFMIFFCIGAVSVAVFYAVSAPHEGRVEAVNGVVDLRGENPDMDVFAIAGEWEFYWDRLLERIKNRPYPMMPLAAILFQNRLQIGKRSGLTWETRERFSRKTSCSWCSSPQT
jgi:hypothetical protein